MADDTCKPSLRFTFRFAVYGKLLFSLNEVTFLTAKCYPWKTFSPTVNLRSYLCDPVAMAT